MLIDDFLFRGGGWREESENTIVVALFFFIFVSQFIKNNALVSQKSIKRDIMKNAKIMKIWILIMGIKNGKNIMNYES